MTLRLIVAVCPLFLAGCSSSSGTATSAAPETPENPQVDQLFSRWDSSTTPGCALGVIRDGQMVYRRNYGAADLGTRTPISPSTVFYIGSMSKQFTAMCVLLLAEEGKLSLTDDIRHYIPEIPDYGHLITIEHLVHHTSGIRDYLLLWMKAGKGYGDAGSIDEESSLALLARQPALDFVPGERYEYSNSNYFLLGTIVKRTSGESLREFARQNIFQPLGMKNTQFLDDQAIVIKNLATGHMLDSRGVPQPLVTGYHLVGDGGVYTTVEDLYRWDQNFYSNQLGKKNQNLIAQFYTRGRLNNGEPVDYASGVVRGKHDELTTIEHGGRFIGYRCDLIRFPERRLSVILLCNSDAIDAQKLSVDVADLFLKM